MVDIGRTPGVSELEVMRLMAQQGRTLESEKQLAAVTGLFITLGHCQSFTLII